jgi:hypothetical protein
MFGKEKKKEEDSSSEDIVQNMVEENKKKIEKEVLIHTMPEKFLSGGNKADQAKIMGVIIFAIAGIFLVALIVILYIILFQSPSKKVIDNDKVKSDNNAQVVEKKLNEDKKEDVAIVKKNDNNLNIDNNIVVSTSSEEIINNDIATSTENEIISTSTPEIKDVPIDSDSDGLDNREEDILGTNIELSDSDGDGYNDLDEIMSLYNPIGSGKLIDNLGIDEYINTSYNYSVLHPTDWKMNILGSDDSIVFKSKDDHIFQIYVQPNSSLQSIERWYKDQVESSLDSKNLINSDNWKGIFSEDGLILYLTDSNYNYIYTLLYISKSDDDQAYKNIFKIMTDSFNLGDF